MRRGGCGSTAGGLSGLVTALAAVACGASEFAGDTVGQDAADRGEDGGLDAGVEAATDGAADVRWHAESGDETVSMSDVGTPGEAAGPDATTEGMPADAAAGDAGSLDGSAVTDSAAVDASGGEAASSDAASGEETLAQSRDRLLATFASDVCGAWASFDPSRRAVFLTITHRLWISRTEDGRPALSHVRRLYAVLGGGATGRECGDDENNRLFLGMDAYLWGQMVATWRGARVIADGGGSSWIRTRDLGGPHDPFDASLETDTGLRCILLVETPESRPPNGQAHFFLEGSARAFSRGTTALPLDPYMLEIDHDYDCLHRSNPLCADFDERYTRNWGDFDCDWVPSACTPIGEGCYRSAR
ncbi:MAG: hypothetical protein NZ898_05500 [Myxococcota bacterium]|nr:hypothetical protein [Myxococcota bacterium]MDW8362368.1 hypothetical protein [Myxococcales bacterium]